MNVQSFEGSIYQRFHKWPLFSQTNRLPGRNFISHTIVLDIQAYRRRIVHAAAIGAVDQALICFHIIINLNIGSIPDILSVTDILRKFLDHIPIILGVKFSKATSNDEAKAAQKQLINAIIGVVAVVVLLSILYAVREPLIAWANS